MAKFVQILFIVSLGISLCVAEAPRARISRFQVKRNHLLARQEAENSPAVVTPYPSADDLKPEVPFDEPAAGADADDEQIPNQPDEVYGPPQQEAADETNDIVPLDEEESTEDEEADLVGEEIAIAEEEAAIAAEEAAVIASSRLTARRNGVSARPAKLRKVQVSRLQLQPQIVPQPIFYYIAK